MILIISAQDVQQKSYVRTCALCRASKCNWLHFTAIFVAPKCNRPQNITIVREPARRKKSIQIYEYIMIHYRYNCKSTQTFTHFIYFINYI